MIPRCLPLSVLTAVLLLPAVPVRAEEELVVPFDAMWDWLMIIEPGSGAQIDPVTVDPDFLETWTTASYNGPAFRRDAAPLSYGGINFLMGGGAPPGTLMDTPAPGTRLTVYFRTTFDLPGKLTNARFDFLVDDGLILYVDGVRWFTSNMAADATSAFGQFSSAVSDENTLLSVPPGPGGAGLPSLNPGRHTLHVSVHNANLASTDIGFMLRLSGEIERTFTPTLTMESAAPGADGIPRLRLRAKDFDPFANVIVQESTDLSNWSTLFTFPPVQEFGSELIIDVPAAASRKYFRLTK